MVDSGSRQVRGTAGPAGQLEIVRRTSLGMTVALLIQYALGMVVNLYVTVPARDQGGGVLVAIGRAFANGPVALAIHAGLGLLILAGTISLVVRSVVSRRRPLIWLTAVTLLAVLGAGSLPLGSQIALDGRLAAVAALGAVILGLGRTPQVPASTVTQAGQRPQLSAATTPLSPHSEPAPAQNAMADAVPEKAAA